MTEAKSQPTKTPQQDEAPGCGGGDRVIEVVGAIADIDPADWDGCANPETAPARGATPSDSASEESYNPFISHDFLNALETSGAVGDGTGWYPRHLVLRDRDEGPVRAVMPAYLKTHSMGEYVFDYGWADAYERAGGRYYPKLQVSVPFTPATGRRLLVRPGPAMAADRDGLIAGAVELCRQAGASSAHWTFVPEDEWHHFGQRGFLQRTDRQFHWQNDGYADFDAFLAALASRKRKAIRRERREALSDGLEIDWLTGADITEAHWDAFFGFYLDTGARKWGRPYLNRAFFSAVSQAMADRILLVMARDGDRYIAGALNFIGDTTLYGRHWGAVEDRPFLHFEVCYYQAMDFAIARGLARVEAGAQGEHKLSRGYLPVTTYSAHYIADRGLREPVRHYLDQERDAIAREQKILSDYAPFRKSEQT